MHEETLNILTYATRRKSVGVAYLLYVFLGSIGIHLLYVGAIFRWFLLLGSLLGIVFFLIISAYPLVVASFTVYALSQLYDLLFLWYAVQRCNDRLLQRLVTKA